MISAPDVALAARQLRVLLDPIDDHALDAPTPCAGFAVGDLLAHLLGLTLAFRHAATRTPLPGPYPGDGQAPLLDARWRRTLSQRLDAMVAGWQDPAAWEGGTEVGGLRLPAADAGAFGVNELVLHGWDLARGTGQDYPCDPGLAERCRRFTAGVLERGLAPYGPPIPVPEGAPALDRLLGLAGRNPAWAP